MMKLCRSSFALLLPVAFALGGLSLAACGGEVVSSPPESTNPQPAKPQPSDPQPGAPQPSDPQPGPQPSGPVANALVGNFGHQGAAPNDYDGATIAATATAAAFDFQCMHADTNPIVVDASGAFTTQGTVTSTGGPEESFPNAKFTGTVDGNTLTVTASWQTTVTTSTGTMPYTLTYGPATFTKGLVPSRQAGCI